MPPIPFLGPQRTNRDTRTLPAHGKPPFVFRMHWDHELRIGAFPGAEVGRLESRPSEQWFIESFRDFAIAHGKPAANRRLGL